jgi:hypothetical protein
LSLGVDADAQLPNDDLQTGTDIPRLLADPVVLLGHAREGAQGAVASVERVVRAATVAATLGYAMGRLHGLRSPVVRVRHAGGGVGRVAIGGARTTLFRAEEGRTIPGGVSTIGEPVRVARHAGSGVYTRHRSS